MRQGQQNRSRGRSRNRKGQSPLARSFESSGPDVKIRGTPAHIGEKYVALARDAAAAGDPVLAENYMQHAEHYHRIIMAVREQQIQNGDDISNGAMGHGRLGSYNDGMDLQDDFADDESDEFGRDAQPTFREPEPSSRSFDAPRYEPRNMRRGQDYKSQDYPRPQRERDRDRDRGRDRGAERSSPDRSSQDRTASDRNPGDRGQMDRSSERFEDRSERGRERPADRRMDGRMDDRSAPELGRDMRPSPVERSMARPVERTVERAPPNAPERMLDDVNGNTRENGGRDNGREDQAPVRAQGGRRRERFSPTHDQPEFLRRPVRRPRREVNGNDLEPGPESKDGVLPLTGTDDTGE